VILAIDAGGCVLPKESRQLSPTQDENDPGRGRGTLRSYPGPFEFNLFHLSMKES